MSFLKNSRKCFEEHDSNAGPKRSAEKKWTVKSIFGSVRRKIKKMKRIPEEEKNPAVEENDFTDILTCSSKEAVCGTNCQIKMSKCIIYSPLIEPEPSRVDEQGQQYVPLPGVLMDEPGLNDSNTMMIKQSLKEKENVRGPNTKVIVAEMKEIPKKDKKSLKKQKAREEKERKRGEKVEATLQKRLAKSEKKLDMETERRKKVKAALDARIQEEEELMQKIQGKINDFDAKINKKVEKIDAMKVQRKAEKDKPLSWKLDMDFHIKNSLLRRRELCRERNKLCSSKKEIEKRIEKYDFKIGSVHILSDENRKPKPVPPCFFADGLIPPKENIDCGKPGPSGFQNKAFQRYLRVSRQEDDMHSSKNSLNSRISNEEEYESEGKGKDKQDGVQVQKMLTDPVSGSVKNESLYSTQMQNREEKKNPMLKREKDEEKHEKRLAKSEMKLDKETERKKKVKAALNARIQEEEELMQKIQGEIDDFDAKINKKVEKIDAMKAQRKAEKDKPLSWKLDMDFHIKKSLLRKRELCGERNKLCSSKKKIEKQIKYYDHRSRSVRILSEENRKPKPVPSCFFADGLIPPRE